MVSRKENVALDEFKKVVKQEFSDAELILYGSKATGQADEWSDIDVLVLLNDLSTENEELIFDLAYDIDLKYDVVLSPLVDSKKFWESPLAKEMPIHKNIQKEGISL